MLSLGLWVVSLGVEFTLAGKHPVATKRRRSRGRQGSFKVSVSPTGMPEGRFEPVDLGHSKEDVEITVMESFVSAMRANGATIHAYQQNDENDLDFTLQTIGGTVKVELTEVVPPANPNSSPYGGQSVMTMGELADLIVAAVRKKAAHYPGLQKTPIHLLTYPTHFSVSAPHEAIAIARIALQQELPTPLENVFWVEPGRVTPDKRLRVLYPADISKYPLDQLERERSRQFIQMDPAGAVLRGNIGGNEF